MKSRSQESNISRKPMKTAVVPDTRHSHERALQHTGQGIRGNVSHESERSLQIQHSRSGRLSPPTPEASETEETKAVFAKTMSAGSSGDICYDDLNIPEMSGSKRTYSATTQGIETHREQHTDASESYLGEEISMSANTQAAHIMSGCVTSTRVQEFKADSISRDAELFQYRKFLSMSDRSRPYFAPSSQQQDMCSLTKVDLSELREENQQLRLQVNKLTRKIIELEADITHQRDDHLKISRFVETERRRVVTTLERLGSSAEVEAIKVQILDGTESMLNNLMSRILADLVKRFPGYFTTRKKSVAECFDEIVSCLEVLGEDQKILSEQIKIYQRNMRKLDLIISTQAPHVRVPQELFEEPNVHDLIGIIPEQPTRPQRRPLRR